MSITELSVAEFYYTVGRLIEAVDYILPTFKKVAEAAPEAFGRLVELIETLQLSIKNSIEIRYRIELSKGVSVSRRQLRSVWGRISKLESAEILSNKDSRIDQRDFEDAAGERQEPGQLRGHFRESCV